MIPNQNCYVWANDFFAGVNVPPAQNTATQKAGVITPAFWVLWLGYNPLSHFGSLFTSIASLAYAIAHSPET